MCGSSEPKRVFTNVCVCMCMYVSISSVETTTPILTKLILNYVFALISFHEQRMLSFFENKTLCLGQTR